MGHIARPHGLRGEVIVTLSTNRLERIAPGTRLFTDRGELEIVRSSAHQHRFIVEFAGVASREAAEALKGVVLKAEPLDDPDELWVHELIGSTVVTAAGDEVGTVTSVEANPASDLLVLESGHLVPLRFVVDRTEPGRLVVDVPPGLLD